MCGICATAGSVAFNRLTPIQVHDVVTLNSAAVHQNDAPKDEDATAAVREHFRFFDLSVTAALPALKAAYHRRLREAHPDKNAPREGDASLAEVKHHFQQAKAWRGRAPSAVAAVASASVAPGGGGGSKGAEASSQPRKVNMVDTACTICLRPFSMFVLRHHCRKCGQSVCGQCSPEKRQLSDYGFEGLVRHCTACIEDPERFQMADQNVLRLTDRVCPKGQQYLSNMIIAVRVTGGEARGDVNISCHFEPKPVGGTQNDTPVDVDPALRTYQHVVTRTEADFQWLRRSLLQAGHSAKRLPPLHPGKHATPLLQRAFAAMSRDRDKLQHTQAEDATQRLQVLLTFLNTLTVHPMFQNNQWVWAFLGLSPAQLRRLRKLPHTRSNSVPVSDDTRDIIDACRSAHGVQHWMQFLIEQHSVEVNMVELTKRNTALAERKARAHDREVGQDERRDWHEQTTAAHGRRHALSTARSAHCEAQTAREKKRLLEQQQTPKLVFIDRRDDVKDFKAMSSERIANRRDFEDMCSVHGAHVLTCDGETVANDQADRECCADNHDWIPPLHRWMLNNYNFVPKVLAADVSAPRLTVDLVRDREALLDGVASFTSDADKEKMNIDLESERLANEKATALPAIAALITTESERWSVEDAAFKSCAAIRSEEQALRSAKEDAVTNDLERREHRLRTRTKCQQDRRMQQAARRNALAQRTARHSARASACSTASDTVDALTQSGLHRTEAARTMLRQQEQERVLLKFPRGPEVAERRRDQSTGKQCANLLQGQHQEATMDLRSSSTNTDDAGKDEVNMRSEAKANEERNPRTKHEAQERPPAGDAFHMDVFKRRLDVDKGLADEFRRLQVEQQELARDSAASTDEQRQLQIELQCVSTVANTTKRVLDGIDREDALFAKEQQLLAHKRSALMQNIDQAAAVQHRRTTSASKLRDSLAASIDNLSKWHHRGQQVQRTSSDRAASAAAAADEASQIGALYTRHVHAQRQTRERLFYPKGAVPSTAHAQRLAEINTSHRCHDADEASSMASQQATCTAWAAGHAREQYNQVHADTGTHRAAMECWGDYEAAVANLAPELRRFRDTAFVEGVRRKVEHYRQRETSLAQLMGNVQELLGRTDVAAATCSATLDRLDHCLATEEQQLSRLEQSLRDAHEARQASLEMRASREQSQDEVLRSVWEAATVAERRVNDVHTVQAEISSSVPNGDTLRRAAADLNDATARSRGIDSGSTSHEARAALGIVKRIHSDCPFNHLRAGAYDYALQNAHRIQQELAQLQDLVVAAQRDARGLRVPQGAAHPEDEWLQSFDSRQQQLERQLAGVWNSFCAATSDHDDLLESLQCRATQLAGYQDLVHDTHRRLDAKVAQLQSALEQLLQEEEHEEELERQYVLWAAAAAAAGRWGGRRACALKHMGVVLGSCLVGAAGCIASGVGWAWGWVGGKWQVDNAIFSA